MHGETEAAVAAVCLEQDLEIELRRERRGRFCVSRKSRETRECEGASYVIRKFRAMEQCMDSSEERATSP